MPPESNEGKDPKAVAAAHKAAEMLVNDPHHVRQNLILIHTAITKEWADIDTLAVELPAILIERLKDPNITLREKTRLAMVAEKLVNSRLGNLMRLTELEVEMTRKVGDQTQINVNIVNDTRRQLLEDPDYVEYLRIQASQSGDGTQPSEADSDPSPLGPDDQSTVQITEAHSSHRPEVDRIDDGFDRSTDDLHAPASREERVSQPPLPRMVPGDEPGQSSDPDESHSEFSGELG